MRGRVEGQTTTTERGWWGDRQVDDVVTIGSILAQRGEPGTAVVIVETPTKRVERGRTGTTR